jgi:hypothetical protein
MLTVYNELINKLDKFIRKYHTSQLIKGLLWFISGFAGLFLIFVLLEYYGYFNTLTRAILFYGFLVFNLVVLFLFVARPVAGILKLGKRISFEEAAKILGKHFKNEIDDKITNTLQLKKYLDENPGSADLIIAGIEQKSSKLKTVPFTNAVDFKVNMKYVPYALGLFIILVGGWQMFPFVFKESAGRIIRYEQQYERPAPFQINILNSMPIKAVKNERFKLEIQAVGNVLPAHVDINFRNTTQRMISKDKNTFEYEFRSVNEPIQFYLSAGNFNFGPWFIDVISKATLKNFSITANYPEYTGLGQENFLNIGDIEVPLGTKLRWEVYTEDTDSILFYYDGDRNGFEEIRKSVYKFETSVLIDFQYDIIAKNDEFGAGDSLSYFVRTKPDLYPSISLREYQDSVMLSHVFFEGLIRDDYGFTDLVFITEFTREISQKMKPMILLNTRE